MILARRFLWHWSVDSTSSGWIADAEMDIAKFSGPIAVTFSAVARVPAGMTLAVVIASGGAAETVGTTSIASGSASGPLSGTIAGANVARVDPAQGKILLHLSASVTSGVAELQDVTITLSDE